MTDSFGASPCLQQSLRFHLQLGEGHWLLSQKIGSSNISVKDLIMSNFREHEHIRLNEALISS